MSRFDDASTRNSLAAGLMALLLVVVAAGAARADDTKSARDLFSNASYDGSNGAIDWSGPWAEAGEADGPATGVVFVDAHDECVAGNCLQIGGAFEPIHDRGVSRSVDLAGASSATLTYTYSRDPTGATLGAVVVGVSDGDGSWDTLDILWFDGTPGLTVRSHDITAYISPTTSIRFLGSLPLGVVKGLVLVDDVEIVATFPETPTTTTTTTTTVLTTTTTTVPPTTTTTVPPTTTTTQPTTTTTSLPPTTTTTTTTVPPTTTTTVPEATTTTVATTVPSTTTTTVVAQAAPTTTSSTTTTTSTSTTTTVVSGSTSPPASSTTTTSAAPAIVIDERFPPERVPMAAEEPGENVRLTPIEGLTVAFSAAVEAITGHARSAVVLGLLAAGLVILGLERRPRSIPARRRRQVSAS